MGEKPSAAGSVAAGAAAATLFFSERFLIILNSFAGFGRGMSGRGTLLQVETIV